ncbi:MAG TPA: DUF350 domain-containing protein [Chloroflexota bacterium]|nr:DUF350 domain-containing protein [Chloroflexota bacterium]
MEVGAFLNSVLSSVVWAVLGVLLLILAFRIFDLSDPVRYHTEIENGNVSAGIVMAGVMIGMSIIIFAAIR